MEREKSVLDLRTALERIEKMKAEIKDHVGVASSNLKRFEAAEAESHERLLRIQVLTQERDLAIARAEKAVADEEYQRGLANRADFARVQVLDELRSLRADIREIENQAIQSRWADRAILLAKRLKESEEKVM